MKNRIVSVILSVLLTVTCVISFAYGEEQVDNNTDQNSSSYTILSHNQLGNTFHRMTSETITEDGISYLKLTPTTDALVPKIDKYGLNLDLSPYNYIKIRYKTTLENYSMLFDVMNATSFSTDLTFAVPQSDVWVSQVLPIYTTNTSVLKQYHFSVFGNNNASALQGEEFCIEYIGFFDKYENALNYRNVETDIKAAPAGLGEDYVITGEDFCDNIKRISDPQNNYTFSASPDGKVLHATVQDGYEVCKIQFRPQELTGIPFVREEYSYVKLKMKYYGTVYVNSVASIIEGYSPQSASHNIGTLPTYLNNTWFELIAPVEWIKSDNNHSEILTLKASNSGLENFSLELCIDYLGFFKDEESARAYGHQDRNLIITGEDLAAAYADGEIFDPDEMLSFSSAAEADGSYKVTFQTRSDVGKIEFRTNTFSDYLVDKENNRFVAVRYKYDFAHPERSYKSTLREGFSEYSTNHELFSIPQNQNNEWLFQIAEVEWGTANEGDHIFTFHPIRGGDYANQGDKFYIDYIGFFKTREQALQYEAGQPDADISASVSLDGSIDLVFPDTSNSFGVSQLEMHYFPALPEYYDEIVYISCTPMNNIVIWSQNDEFYYSFNVDIPSGVTAKNILAIEYVGSSGNYKIQQYNIALQ